MIIYNKRLNSHLNCVNVNSGYMISHLANMLNRKNTNRVKREGSHGR